MLNCNKSWLQQKNLRFGVTSSEHNEQMSIFTGVTQVLFKTMQVIAVCGVVITRVVFVV